jgi:23S rRNA (cytidine1920-2'-O)/16S rRNA (cytidine1409-2'-O)-methyltransferase
MERTNVRSLDPAVLGGAVPLAAVDLAFISLLTVAPALARCTTDDSDLVLLVKPQFEAGRARVGKGGVVRDPSVHAAVLVAVSEGLERSGLSVVAAMPSPILGAQGNREFLAHCRHGGHALDADRLAALAEAATPAESGA